MTTVSLCAFLRCYCIIDYNSRTTLHVCTHAIFHGGTPYALLDKAQDYPLNLETAKHELAHTVRYTLARKINSTYSKYREYTLLFVQF